MVTGGDIILSAMNFGEARDARIVDEIARNIASVEKIRILEVDPDKELNRTIIVFGGPSQNLLTSLYRSVETAANYAHRSSSDGASRGWGFIELIPLIPIHSRHMPTTIQLARNFAQDVADSYQLPVYLFGEAALRRSRKDFWKVRRMVFDYLQNPDAELPGKPDFGPGQKHQHLGMTLIGTRFHYITFAIYLDTENLEDVNNIVETFMSPANFRKLSRKSRFLRALTEQTSASSPAHILKHVKISTDYLSEEKLVRIVCRVLNYRVVPVHLFYESLIEAFSEAGYEVFGNQVFGYVPAEVLIEAGKFYFAGKIQEPLDDLKFITLAINRLRLNSIDTFDTSRQILDFYFSNRY